MQVLKKTSKRQQQQGPLLNTCPETFARWDIPVTALWEGQM